MTRDARDSLASLESKILGKKVVKRLLSKRGKEILKILEDVSNIAETDVTLVKKILAEYLREGGSFLCI